MSNRSTFSNIIFSDSKNQIHSQVIPLFYISHSFKIAGHSTVFTDNNIDDSAFFQTSPLNSFHSPITYDSLRYVEINNDISIGSGKAWNNFLRWEIGARDQWVYFRNFMGQYSYNSESASEQLSYMYNYADTVYNNLIAHARIYNAFDKGKILFDLSGQYIFEGTQQGDQQGLAQIGLKIDSSRFLKLSGSYSNQTPPFIYELYEGNGFNWINQLYKTTASNIALTYYDAKWNLGLTIQATQMTNMVYFDTLAQPMQYHPTFMVYCAGITKDFKVYKFHWTTSEKLQYVADSIPLRLPRLVTENSVFFESYLFHHALFMRLGADFYYNTSYYGYAYMPVTDQYYLENSTKLGNYLYVDPFVSFRHKNIPHVYKTGKRYSRFGT